MSKMVCVLEKINLREMWFVILIVPLITDAKLTMNITASHNIGDIKIHCYGYDNKVVTEKELKVFNVTNGILKKGARVELGKVPKNIFLKNPTPYGNLFDKFNWPEVKRNIVFKKAKVIDVLTEDVVLDSHEHINNTPNNITSKRSMFKVIENNVRSFWTKPGIPDDEIYYNINLNFTYGYFYSKHKWRNETLQTAKMPIGLTKEGSIVIKPEQTVVTKLNAYKTILLIEMVYEARLIGSIVANFAELYGKYHFWAPSVKSIMKAAELKNEVITTQLVEIRFYTNPRLAVYDKLTNEVMEPPRKKKPQMKILRKNNVTQILYLKTKKVKQRKNK